MPEIVGQQAIHDRHVEVRHWVSEYKITGAFFPSICFETDTVKAAHGMVGGTQVSRDRSHFFSCNAMVIITNPSRIQYLHARKAQGSSFSLPKGDFRIFQEPRKEPAICICHHFLNIGSMQRDIISSGLSSDCPSWFTGP